jgi:uncharacterized membrane protein YfcA
MDAATLSGAQLGVLAPVVFLTAMLSAVVGLAGGITLLAVMLLFFDPLVAIPLHGVIQLVSNSSRAVVQRRHVEWGIVARYALPLLPMGFLGLAVARTLPPSALRAFIGCFVVVATWRPAWLLLGAHPEAIRPTPRFLGLGATVGVLNVTIGATGPLIAPFFLNTGLARFGVIGTMAACQTLGHLAKLLVFGATGFAFAGYAGPLALLCALAVAGTWVGSRLLERVNERWFRRIYKLVLTAIALELVAEEAVRLLA